MAVVDVTVDTFETEVLKAEGTVLVDFWAAWCAPCRMLSPIIDQIADEKPDVKVCKVNIDEQAALAIDYKVMSIPTVLVFKNGEVANKSIGVVSKSELLEML